MTQLQQSLIENEVSLPSPHSQIEGIASYDECELKTPKRKKSTVSYDLHSGRRMKEVSFVKSELKLKPGKPDETVHQRIARFQKIKDSKADEKVTI